jgi:outer membrane biosynthesis protein TonB
LRFADADALRIELVAAGTGKGATVVARESMPIPAADLHARYAVAAPVGRAAASSRRWLVPLAALGFALVGVLGAIALRGYLQPSSAAPDEPVREEIAPAIAAPVSTPAVAPIDAPTRAREVPVAPASPPTAIADPSIGVDPPEPPAKAIAKPRPKREKPATPKPSETVPPKGEPPEPASPPPTTSPPKRDGDTFQPFRK